MKREERGIDIIAIIKERLSLLKVGFIPLILIFVGIYLLIKSSQSAYLSDRDWLLNNIGLTLAIIGIISLFVVFIIKGIRTFKRWQVIEKQKVHFKTQHPTHKWIFIALIILIILWVSVRGYTGFTEAAKIFDWIIIIAAIWSIALLVKKRNLSAKK